MANIIWWVITLLFVGIVSYAIGCRRGWKTYEHDYDIGWNAAADYYEKNYELIPIEKMMDELARDAEREHHKRRAKLLVDELDDLFKDDDIIDGGTY